MPENCDPAADAKEPAAAGCVADSYAVFVNGAGGNDSAEGTRAAPLKTVKAAIAKAAATGRPRAYVCAGTYDEHAVLTTAVSLLGGFACGTWSYDGTKARLSPTTPGYALHLDRPAGKVVVSDMELSSPDALEAGASSIAVFANGADLLLRRASVSARAGKLGGTGDEGVAGVLIETQPTTDPLDPRGRAASGDLGGGAKICVCDNSDAERTGGGPGGNGNGTGTAGSPLRDAGAGGAPGGDCTSPMEGIGGRGADGAAAPPAERDSKLGTLSASGWAPAGGADGVADGRPGQGGGGGGGQSLSLGGGGGGCGGCGGRPGKRGLGGGGSIGVVAFESAVEFQLSVVHGADGGRGGTGGAGGRGGDGAIGGPGSCGGGPGGKGGAGSAASGGAGGISAGVLFQGSAPTLDAATEQAISVGAFGAGGTGGAPGVNDGPPGRAAAVLDAATL